MDEERRQELFPHSQAVVVTQHVEGAVFRSFSEAVGTRVVRLGASGTAAAYLRLKSKLKRRKDGSRIQDTTVQFPSKFAAFSYYCTTLESLFRTCGSKVLLSETKPGG